MPEERKTINTPVEQATLDRFAELDETKSRLCERYVALENEKIRLLASVRRLDEERSSLFQSILVDRGLSPDTPIQIDPETGVIVPDGAPEDAPVPEPGTQSNG